VVTDVATRDEPDPRPQQVQSSSRNPGTFLKSATLRVSRIVVGQRNRGDPEVHRRDADAARPQRLEQPCGDIVERTYPGRREVRQDLLEHRIAVDDARTVRGPTDVSIPAQDLLVKADDGDEEVGRRPGSHPTPQSVELGLRLALEDGEVVRVDQEHAGTRGLSRRAAA